MASAFGPIRTWLRHGTSQTTNIVVSVLKQHPEYGLTTKELYDKAHTMFPDAVEPAAPPPKDPETYRSRKGQIISPPPRPEHANHPIRSTRYLKTVVLKELQGEGVIEKVSFRTLPEDTPPVDVKKAVVRVWRWRLPLTKEGSKDPDPASAPRK